MSNSNDIQAVIFDLGNVVFECSFEPTYEYWGALTKQGPATIATLLNNNDHEDLFEKDMMSAEEFRVSVSRSINYTLTQEQFERGWNAIYGKVISGVLPFLQVLKNKYRLIALTNTNKTHSRVWVSRYQTVLSEFEKIFCSHEMGTRKPEAEAYQICLDYLRLRPNESVFLDDRAENIQGAKNMGIHGIQVYSFDQMLHEMNKLGVAC